MSFLLGQYPVHLHLTDCSMSCEGLGGGGVRAVQVQASQQASFTVGLGVGTRCILRRAATRLPNLANSSLRHPQLLGCLRFVNTCISMCMCYNVREILVS